MKATGHHLAQDNFELIHGQQDGSATNNSFTTSLVTEVKYGHAGGNASSGNLDVSISSE